MSLGLIGINSSLKLHQNLIKTVEKLLNSNWFKAVNVRYSN